MYLTWLIARGLHDPEFFAALPDGKRYLSQIVSRKRTAMALRQTLDGTLPSEILSTEAQAFSDWYYGDQYAKYLDDWVAEFGEDANRYAVPDSWGTFDRIAPHIDAQFDLWIHQASQWDRASDSEPPSDSVAPSLPLVDNPVDAAAQAIAAAGGNAVPGPIDRLRTELTTGLSTHQLAQLAVHVQSGSVTQRRVAATKLAVAPMTDEIVAILRRAALSSDPVVAAIASNALGRQGYDGSAEGGP
jgi:hypothetical protein